MGSNCLVGDKEFAREVARVIGVDIYVMSAYDHEDVFVIKDKTT